MKNLFSWSVLVSAFTILFYWYGYWYMEGYIRYFGHNIKAYDIVFQHIITTGALQYIVPVIKQIAILIGLSFIIQFSKNQWLYFFNVFQVIVLHIVLAVFLFFRIFFINPFKNRKNSKEVKTNNNLSLKYQIIKFKNLMINIRANIIEKYVNLDNLSGFKREINILNGRRKALEEEIEKEDNTSFDVQYIIHTIIIFSIFAFIMSSLNYTQKVNKNGFNDADDAYNCSIIFDKKGCNNYYSQIIIPNVQTLTNVSNSSGKGPSQKWYLTDICLNRRCLVFNENKRAKFIDITDKEIVMKGD